MKFFLNKKSAFLKNYKLSEVELLTIMNQQQSGIGWWSSRRPLPNTDSSATLIQKRTVATLADRLQNSGVFLKDLFLSITLLINNVTDQ